MLIFRSIIRNISVGAVASLGIDRSYSDWDYNWDKRQHLVSNDKEKKRIVHRVYLIRHGQYVSGKEDKERILTPLGREQAQETGVRLARLLKEDNDKKLTRFVYSTMSRATETALLIKGSMNIDDKEVDIVSCSMIREGACYKPEPPIAKERWPVTEEDFFKDTKRIEAGFRNYIYRPDQTKEDSESTCSILVCHGNVIRYFVCRALQITPAAWLRMAVYNASITTIEIWSDGKVSLRGLGDVGHFTPKKITYS